MATGTSIDTLIDQLAHTEGKAEIVAGKVERMSPTGDYPSSASGVVFASLLAYAREHGGRAYPDNAAYIVELPDRTSFSPDASYYTGPRSGMRFLNGAPDFAVEIRSEGDYGPAAERRIAAKRADYFAAGTKVVWDVDLLGEATIRSYTSADGEPAVFRRGEIADAERAVPGWKFPVSELFE